MNAECNTSSPRLTTTVDAGTAGWRDFPDFKTPHDRAGAYLPFQHPMGMVTASQSKTQPMQPKWWQRLRAYPDVIVGIKTAHTDRNLGNADIPWLRWSGLGAGSCAAARHGRFWRARRSARIPSDSAEVCALRHPTSFRQQFPIIDDTVGLRSHVRRLVSGRSSSIRAWPGALVPQRRSGPADGFPPD